MIQYRYQSRNVKQTKRKDKFMKKVLSSILALVMLISTFAISSTSAYARAKGSKVELDTTTEFTISDDNGITVNFTPAADGLYEFGIDTKISNPGNQVIMMSIYDSSKGVWQDDYLVAMAGIPTSYNNYENEAASVAGKLKAGKTYNVQFELSGYAYPQKVNLSVSNHKHTWKKVIYPAVYTRFLFDGKVVSDKSDGYDASHCNVCGEEVKSKVYKPYCKIKLSKTSYTYDGKAKKPSVTITNAKGQKYSPSQYTVEYSNNKKVGYGIVSIMSKDNADPHYSVIADYIIKINPKGTSIKSVSAAKKGFTVKYKKQATQTTGYQIQYATDKNFKKNKKTVTVKKNKTTSVKVKKLKAKKKYYVRVRTYKNVKDTDGNAKKLYSSWSKTKTVKTKK